MVYNIISFLILGGATMLMVVFSIAILSNPILAESTEDSAEVKSTVLLSPDYFVVIYEAGPRWIEGTDYLKTSLLQEHAKYMEELFARGIIVVGGPFLNGPLFTKTSGSGLAALLVLRVDSAEKAEKLIGSDPLVLNGIARITVYAWKDAFHKRLKIWFQEAEVPRKN